jgi:6-phospho-beta-glucosidase
MREAAPIKVVGICDTPTELFEEVAHALDLPSAECFFDYVGLNHLGWLREVYWRGEAQLPRLWARPDLLRAVYRAPLFDPARLSALRLLPTEYVYYYEQAQAAFTHLQRAGRSRGDVIVELNAQLFRELRAGTRDPLQAYEAYLAARNAGYMQLESGAQAPLPRSPWAEVTGYDKIALATVRSIRFNTGAIIPLNVANRGNLDGLEADDVIEVPCTVNANGALALHAGPLPAAVAPLVRQVKRYERATIHAATTGERTDAVAALALNPLVPSVTVADRLAAALLPPGPVA